MTVAIIVVTPVVVTADRVAKIREICEKNRGKSPLHVTLKTRGGYHIAAVADKRLAVRADVELKKQLEKVVGSGKVQFRGQ